MECKPGIFNIIVDALSNYAEYIGTKVNSHIFKLEG